MLVNGREALMPLVRLDSYGPLIGVWGDMLAASPVVPVGSGEAAAIVRAYKKRHAGPDSWFGNHLESVAVEIEQTALRQPVVPVGVSREEIADILRPMVRSVAANSMFTADEREDYLRRKVAAILAALRPTDTGGQP
jgi:hypothetical protein